MMADQVDVGISNKPAYLWVVNIYQFMKLILTSVDLQLCLLPLYLFIFLILDNYYIGMLPTYTNKANVGPLS